MRKIFFFSSILLLFVATLAHSPPRAENPGVTVEFVADDLSFDGDITVYDYINRLDQVALPFIGDMISFPIVTVMANPGTLDVNYVSNTSFDATQANTWELNNLFWQSTTTMTNLTHQRNLAINEIQYLVTEPTRLGVGKLSGQTFYT